LRQALAALRSPMPSHQFGVDVFQMCLQLQMFLGMEREEFPR
jgi:hypothetical protein